MSHHIKLHNTGFDDRKKTKGKETLGILNEFLKESSYAELKRKAENRKEWRIWEAKNLPHGRTLTTTNTGFKRQ